MKAIAASGGAGYALVGDGRLWAWGDDEAGQTGSGEQVNQAESVHRLPFKSS